MLSRECRWRQDLMPHCKPSRIQRSGLLCLGSLCQTTFFQREGAWFDLDHDRFAKNLRVAKRGAAGGPSSMTTDHFRPLLESVEDTTRLWRLAQDLSRAVVPDEIVDVVRLGRLTALQKPSGGVRGIVAGDDLPTIGHGSGARHGSVPVRSHHQVWRRVHRTRTPDFDRLRRPYHCSVN